VPHRAGFSQADCTFLTEQHLAGPAGPHSSQLTPSLMPTKVQWLRVIARPWEFTELTVWHCDRTNQNKLSPEVRNSVRMWLFITS